MRLILVVTLILPLSAFAGPKELAEKLEAGKRETVCDAAEAALRGTLDHAWDIELAHDVFVKACNANPKAADLFPGSTKTAIDTKTKAYCEFRPALRLCMVCRLLTKAVPELRSAADACKDQFRDGERLGFNAQVLGIKPEPPANPDTAGTDAR